MIDHATRFWGRRPAFAVVLAASAWFWFAPLVLAQAIESTQAPAAVARDRPGVQDSTSTTRLDYRTAPAAIVIDLPALDATPEVERDELQPRIPHRIGVPLSVPEHHQGDLLRDATWTLLPDDARVTSITLHSPGAGRLRAALRGVLPEGARVRFFGPAGSDAAGYPVYTGEHFANRGADHIDSGVDHQGGMLWSPIVDGDTLGIEVELPHGTQLSQAQLHVVLTSHIFPEQATAPTGNAGHAAAQTDELCPLVDVACKELPDFPTKAVTRLVITTNDGTTGTCSGTIINTHRSETDNSLDPYLLTAHHCIPTQDEADSAEFDFFYAYETCDGSRVSDEHIRLRSGARLLVTDPSTDLSLLELRSSLPAGAWLAGWDVNLVGTQEPGSEVVSISHPHGEPLKYAAGSTVAYGVTKVDDLIVDRLTVDWSEGLTLPGSSGGGLWAFDEEDDQWRLIAALSGAPDDEACPVTGADFGRFDLFYVNEAQRYLNPDEPPTDDHGGSFSSATGILPGSETSGEINHRADADMFRLVVTEPGTLVLTTTGGTNTVGRLLREDGTVIEADLVGGYRGNFRIAAYLEEGTYFVRVSGYDPKSEGAYRLQASFTADSEQPAAQIPLFLAASHAGRQGFVRLFNASSNDGSVQITAFDDEGDRYGPLTLSLDAQQTRHFNSDDLEGGNASKGLAGRTGTGSGDWRLRFDTDLPIEVASYIRTDDGFLTPMHDAAHFYKVTGRHFVPVFNPGSNTDRLSKLRLVNPDMSREVRVAIFGQDDAGRRSSGTVELTLPPGASRTVDAAKLETGASELSGSLGDGQGKWRLWVEAEGDIVVLNLLDSVSGHLSNLSSPGQIVE